MLDTSKLLYILYDTAIWTELLPGKSDNKYEIQAFRQINGQYFDKREFIEENVVKLIDKLEETKEQFSLVLPDEFFTNTILDFKSSSEAKVKKYIKDKLIPEIGLTEDTHIIEAYVLTEHRGNYKIQVSALEKSLLSPLYKAIEKNNYKIDKIFPLSWTLKSVISLEPSLLLAQVEKHVYLSLQFIGVDQTISASVDKLNKIVETVKTLKGSEPSIQNLYLLTDEDVETDLKEELKDILPIQQLAKQGKKKSKIIYYLKEIIENSIKTISVKDYQVPEFTMPKSIKDQPTKKKEEEKKEVTQKDEDNTVEKKESVKLQEKETASTDKENKDRESDKKEETSDKKQESEEEKKDEKQDTKQEITETDSVDKAASMVKEPSLPKPTIKTEKESNSEEDNKKESEEEKKADNESEKKEEEKQESEVIDLDKELSLDDETNSNFDKSDEKEKKSETQESQKKVEVEQSVENTKPKVASESDTDDKKEQNNSVDNQDKEDEEDEEDEDTIDLNQFIQPATSDEEEKISDTDEEKEPELDVKSESKKEEKKQDQIIKNDDGLGHTMKIILIGLISFLITIAIGVGVGYGLLKLSDKDKNPPAENEQVVDATDNQDQEPTTAPTATVEPTKAPELDKEKISVLVVNDTTIAGYAGKMSDKLDEAGYKIVDAKNAKGDYDQGFYLLAQKEDEQLLEALTKDLDLDKGDVEYTQGYKIEDPSGKYDVVVVLAAE